MMTSCQLIRSSVLQMRLFSYSPTPIFVSRCLPQLYRGFALSKTTNQQTNVAQIRYLHTNRPCCTICSQPFTPKFPLSNKSNNGMTCVGCKILLAPYRTSPEMQRMIISRLREKPLKHKTFICEQEIPNDQRSSTLVKSMKSRKRRLIQAHENNIVMDGPPSPQEIAELIKSSDSRCAVSGILGDWRSSYHSLPSPFFLEIDHTVPISKGGSFGINNLQVTVRCVNQVKGNNSDDELRRWLKGFRKANSKTIKILVPRKQ